MAERSPVCIYQTVSGLEKHNAENISIDIALRFITVTAMFHSFRMESEVAWVQFYDLTFLKGSKYYQPNTFITC